MAIFIPEEGDCSNACGGSSSGGGQSSSGCTGLATSRRSFRGRNAHSESTTNLMHFDADSHHEMGDMEETLGFSDQEEEQLEHSVAFAPYSTERRRCV